MSTGQISADNRRIARNSVYLYLRLGVMTLITLISSRLLLQNLGISDYGVYNVVCGIVLFFSFINGTLTGGTQRYLNFSIGKNHMSYTNAIFRVALTNHLVIACIAFVIIEIIGNILLFTVINVPTERFIQSIWVFQASALSLVMILITVPYQATVIAYERMNIYAVMGVFDAILKLLAAAILIVFNSDNRLIYYGFALLAISIINFYLYKLLCIHKFYICKFKLLWKWRLNKELLSFSGWDSIAWVSGSASFNIINILLNIFLGTIVNAAYGIATQISGLISQLINSFQNAINPQIVKLYAKNDNVNLYRLMCNSCKYSCVLVSFFAIPIYLRVEYFLSIWLGDYPNLTPEFARIMIVQSLIIGFTRPIVNSVHATAKLKYPCIFSSLIFLFIIPLAALLLYLKVEPTIVMSINVLPWFLEGMVNMYFVRKYLGVDISTFPNKVILITLMIIAVTWSLTYFISCILPEGLIYSIILIVFSIIIGATSTYALGFDSDTKRMIKNRLIAFSSK